MTPSFKYQVVRKLEPKIGSDLYVLLGDYLCPSDMRKAYSNVIKELNSRILLKSGKNVLFHKIPIAVNYLKEDISRLFYVTVSNRSRQRQCEQCSCPIEEVNKANINIVSYPYIEFGAMDALYGIDPDLDDDDHDEYSTHGGWLGVAILELLCMEHTEDPEDYVSGFNGTLAECDSYPSSLNSLMDECADPNTIIFEHGLASRLPALAAAEREKTA